MAGPGQNSDGRLLSGANSDHTRNLRRSFDFGILCADGVTQTVLRLEHLVSGPSLRAESKIMGSVVFFFVFVRVQTFERLCFGK